MKATAFIFPGQGSQYVGMGKEFFENFREAREVFQEADDVLHLPISSLCFQGPEEALKLTENTQPAVLTASIAVLRVLQAEKGVVPHLAAGHSLGEYSALVVSGALAFADAVQIVRLRGRFMQEAVPVGEGAMAAILGMERGQVEKLCEEAAQGEVLTPANFNCPGQIVIAGRRVQELSDDALSDFRARHLGFIFQNFNLLPVLTAYENIEYPLWLAGAPAIQRKARVAALLAAMNSAWVGIASTHLPTTRWMSSRYSLTCSLEWRSASGW